MKKAVVLAIAAAGAVSMIAVAFLTGAVAQNRASGTLEASKAQPKAPLNPEPKAEPKPEAVSDAAKAELATESKPAASPAPEVAALIVASQETVLASQMAGRLKAVHIGLGEEVKKGQRLMEFDCSEQAAQLESAEAEYRGARETHLARLRLQALGAAGELEVTVAAAAADKARSQADVRKAQLAYCTVLAPFAGNVARVRVKTAESVNGGQPLLDLVNADALKAQMFVPAAWVSWLRVGTPLSIHVRETGQTFEARVSKLNARVDGVSQQLEVEARVDKGKGSLLPGMVGSAVFQGARQ